MTDIDKSVLRASVMDAVQEYFKRFPSDKKTNGNGKINGNGNGKNVLLIALNVINIIAISISSFAIFTFTGMREDLKDSKVEVKEIRFKINTACERVSKVETKVERNEKEIENMNANFFSRLRGYENRRTN